MTLQELGSCGLPLQRLVTLCPALGELPLEFGDNLLWIG
jgi:hypothetical protein